MNENDYSDDSFWIKLKKYAANAGKDVIESALKLYYALQDSDTPKWAKTVIIGALAYFILPTDAVMDLLPGGYIDDLGALSAAVGTVAKHIKEEHTLKAQEKLQQWFS